MPYSAEISRKYSGMNTVQPTMVEVLDRIRDYDASFPGEIVSVKIEKIESISAVREDLSNSKAQNHQALVNTALGLQEQGYNERAIAENMGVARSAVRILLRHPVNMETWEKK